MLWRGFGAALSLALSIVVPLTIKPSPLALAVLWTAAFVLLGGMIVTAPPVAERLWGMVAANVAPRIDAPALPGGGEDAKQKRLFHAAVACISDDLENLATMLRERDSKRFYQWYSIKTGNWNKHGAFIAVPQHPELHRTVRSAFQALETAFLDSEKLQTGRTTFHDRLKEDRVATALPAVDRAIEALHDAEA